MGFSKVSKDNLRELFSITQIRFYEFLSVYAHFRGQNLPKKQKNGGEKKYCISAQPIAVLLIEVGWLEKKKK
jgi:hypothetical protein